jgi:plasmid stabilization system protein ParE
MAEIEITFHPEARSEYLAVLQRYIGLSDRVGRSFQDEFARCVALIESGPEQWPIFESPVRFLRLRRFPYVIYFERVSDERTQVLAVAHGSRCPGYWRYRRV